MGRRVPKWTEQKIAQRIREGYGQGEHADYKPWLTIRDFSSQGTTTRIFSPKLQRAVTVFSNIERNGFFVAEFDKAFDDYWEQAPIPREETLDIADSLGVKHPVYPGTQIPLVMTLDGVLSLRSPNGLKRKVIDCKPESALSNPRTNQKLAINREYARLHGYDYLLYTERSTPQTVVHNIQWIRMSVTRTGDNTNVRYIADIHRTRLLRGIAHASTFTSPHKNVRDFLTAFDADWLLPRGAALRMVRELMWTHDIEFNLRIPFQSLLVGPLAALAFREDCLPGYLLPAATREA